MGPVAQAKQLASSRQHRVSATVYLGQHLHASTFSPKVFTVTPSDHFWRLPPALTVSARSLALKCAHSGSQTALSVLPYPLHSRFEAIKGLRQPYRYGREKVS